MKTPEGFYISLRPSFPQQTLWRLRMLAMWALRVGSPSMTMCRAVADGIAGRPYRGYAIPTFREAIQGRWS